jgi:ribosomal protein S18 acetylase RimI-like enzyme
MYLLQDKITKYTLDVRSNNLPAIKCYEKVGFIIKEKTKTNYLMEFDFDDQIAPLYI